MSFDGKAAASAAGLALKSFVTEDEIEDKKKKRQEEWEKVRTADQPLECPEEEVDNRSLYDKLQEQKDRKQQEHDDKFKLSNQVRGLDEDESKFLDFVSQRKEEINKKRNEEEFNIMREMRDAAVVKVESTSSSSSSEDKKPAKVFASTSAQSSSKKSQQSLLAGAVKRKRSEDMDQRQSKSEEENQDKPTSPVKMPKLSDNDTAEQAGCSMVNKSSGPPQVAHIVGVLPGMGYYENSSDSESSSSCDSEPDFKLCQQTHISIKHLKQQIESGQVHLG